MQSFISETQLRTGTQSGDGSYATLDGLLGGNSNLFHEKVFAVITFFFSFLFDRVWVN